MTVAPRHRQPKLMLAATMLGACLAEPALAQDEPVIFGGGFIADDHFAYAGALIPLPGARPDQGWAVRPVASAGAYDYRRNATDIEADYVNLELSLVNRRSGDWGYLNLAAGARFSNTDLSQPDPQNRREGSQWDGMVSIDGARYSGAWRLSGYASYAFSIEDYYIRGEVTRATRPNGLRLGLETIIEGDPSYDRQSLGALVAFQPMAGTEARVSVGARMGDRDTEPYLAIGLSRSF
ncbi:cellulose biosynthesis protein BcsS [Brevundimonas sp. NPDC090276]|uniref:cellulose biosynthesis protein BcsS n=1 Tax=Brevundimonas sp. NPDC090276 TaxID=3363956 RepID=UPI00383A76EB